MSRRSCRRLLIRKTLIAAAGTALIVGLTPTAAGANETLPACASYLNLIHKSTSIQTAGKVKVGAKTECTQRMDVITVSVSLYKIENGVEIFLGTSPEPVEYGKYFINRSAVGPECVPGTYVARSLHRAQKGTWTWEDWDERTDRVTCA